MKKFLKVAFLGLSIISIAFFAYFFLVPTPNRDVFEFIPDDAIFMVQSQSPIDDWKEFSDSEVWKYLKTHKELAETHEQADYMDSLITDNKALFSLVGKREVIISAHMTRRNDYDFLYLIDLKKGAKVTFFVDILLGAFDNEALKTEKVAKDGYEIIKIYDEDGDAILLSFVENVLLCSYSDKIILDALKQGEKPNFSSTQGFARLRDKMSEDGPYQVFLNYSNLPSYANLFMDEPSETLEDLGKILRYGTFDLSISDEHIGLEGYSDLQDSVPHLLRGLLEVDDDKLRSPEILPANTSFFLSFDFDEFYTKRESILKDNKEEGELLNLKTMDTLIYGGFYGKILESLAQDKDEFDEMMKSQRRVEKFLKISMEKHFFSWIGNEITLGMVPTNKYGSKQAYLGIFHTNNIDDAKENLKFVTKRIKKKTPVKFKKEEYRGYEVNYMEMKGFFKLFFGKMFKKFEKPHFIYLDDYVVFSNDTSALHRMVDSYEAGETLRKSSEFKSFHNEFSGKSNLFLYMSMPNIFPYLVRMGDHESRMSIDENRNYFTAFKMIGFQMNKKGDRYGCKARGYFEPEEKTIQ